MKFVASRIKINEVRNVARRVLDTYDESQSLKEIAIHYLFKRLPFALLFVISVDFILKFASPYLEVIFLRLLNISDNIYIETIISCIVFILILGICIVGIFKFISIIANVTVPRKTPVSDRQKKDKSFLHECCKIEKDLMIMEKIKSLSKEDIAYSDLIVDENNNCIYIMLKNSDVGIIEKIKYAISDPERMRELKETGCLDFTFIDNEWNNLMAKYPHLCDFSQQIEENDASGAN